MCRNTTEQKIHLSAGPLLFLKREHRSYSHELADISSQRVKVSISCDKHRAAWSKGNEIMYVCGMLSSRAIKVHLYISFFLFQEKNSIHRVPQTNKYCHVQIYTSAGCLAPKTVVFLKRNQTSW